MKISFTPTSPLEMTLGVLRELGARKLEGDLLKACQLYEHMQDVAFGFARVEGFGDTDEYLENFYWSKIAPFRD